MQQSRENGLGEIAIEHKPHQWVIRAIHVAVLKCDSFLYSFDKQKPSQFLLENQFF